MSYQKSVEKIDYLHELTDEEILVILKEESDIIRAIEEIEEEKKQAMADYTKAIKERKEKISRLNWQVQRKIEDRTVMAIVEHDFSELNVKYYHPDTLKLLRCRRMTLEELQLSIPEKTPEDPTLDQSLSEYSPEEPTDIKAPPQSGS